MAARKKTRPAPARPERQKPHAAQAAPPRSAEAAWVAPTIAAVFALSGAAGLVHEVVWARLLGHVFGATSLAVSTVLAAFMGGLALGSWWIGRRIDRIADRRRTYALLEIGIGLSALAVPIALHALEPVYGALWRRFHLSFAAFSVLRFLLAGGLLIVPTLMMGATLPVLADYMAGLRNGQLAPQWLYTVNLLGAVLGTAAAGFVLMPTLGLRGTIVVGAAINVGAGLAVLAMPALAARPEGAVRATAAESRSSTLLLVAAFFSGALSLATQIAWTRVLVLIVGSTTYAFSTVLLVYLIALAAGSALASRYGARLGDVTPALAVTHLLMAVGMMCAIYSVDRLPFWYFDLLQFWRPSSIAGTVALSTLLVFGLLFVPVLFAGMILPLAMIGSLPAGTRHSGGVVGVVYAVNTVGAILGAVLGGFVLLPLLGTQRLLVGVALAGALLGTAFALLGTAERWLSRGAPAVAAALVLAAVLLPGWHHKALNAAVFEPQRLGGAFAIADPTDEILYHREGTSATVVVIEHEKRLRALRINGRFNASDDVEDMPTQVLLPQVPLALVPRTDDVFILGWGSGVSVGSTLKAPVRHLTAVELEPAVVEASRFFERVNYRPLGDPRLELHQDDARHILLASEATYDVMVSEPSHPWITGVASLFTRDFFALAGRRLRDDGIFSQWLQGYQISLETFRSILASFHSVFPEVVVYSPSVSADWILLGSRRPIVWDLEALHRRFEDPAVRAEYARAGIETPEALLAGVYLGPDDVRTVVAGVPLNTDDNMRVEFGAPADVIERRGDSAERITNAMLKHRTAPEKLLVDPAQLLGHRDRIAAFVAGLERQQLDASRYEALLARAPD